ncbi:hypothetical protein N431DRAFT_45035 [Stipitochalara longipes BDJ]|nr:hypothetical protein N431DRAFT_45035 [Stipitochalara longipes BDJ]
MASTDGIVVDLNDPSTLEAYNQILLFKNNPSENELVFRSPDKSRHRTLLSLAHKLDLECEYTLATRTLKISQLAPESTFDTSTIDDLLENVGGVFGDALDSTGISFSPNFEDDFSLEMPQSGQDAPLPGISNHEFRFSNHEAANSSAIALDNVFLHVEEGALGSPTWFPLDLTSLSNIGLQNNTITTPYGDEQVFGHEELCAAVECNLSTERKIAAAPDGPMRQHGQTFVGHKKHKQINALPESTDLQQSQDYLGFTNSEKTHRSVSLPEHQGTSLDLRTEREERGRGYLEQLLWRQSPTQQAEPLWENWAVSSADTGVRSMLNAEDFAEHEAARPLNGLALHSEKSAKKRKNAERSVSPIYNSQPMSTMPPSAPIPINNSPMNLPSKQTFLESVRSKVHRIICSQSQCHREFSQQGLLNEHICHDHHIAANPNLSKKNGASQLTSANGQQIDRGRSGVRNLYSRRSSLEAPQSPLGYEEIVFDARSDQSSGHASLHSNASCASGRRGPLSDAARTGMSALRAIGACWRCKL